MIRSAKSLGGFRIQAKDGTIGRAHDLLFDDEKWIVRYLTVRTTAWLSKQEKLISPLAIGQPDWSSHSLPVELTVDQVKNSPDIDADKPVSLQRQIELHEYYGWPPYWAPVDALAMPTPIPSAVAKGIEEAGIEEKGDLHLRSALEVINYRVQAGDDEVGYVWDFLLEHKKWVIRYIAVKTRMWLPAKKVLVSPLWMDKISWKDKKVYLDVPENMVRNSPKYVPSATVNREYEARLYDYYGRPKYWL